MWAVSREFTPPSHNQLPSDCRSAGGRVGRRPIPQGRAAPFRRPAQSERLPRVWGRVLSSGECPRRLLLRPQSAHSPQMVRKTPRNGQHRPTRVNDKCAGQVPFSFTAHCAKPPLGRFCKAVHAHRLRLSYAAEGPCGTCRPGWITGPGGRRRRAPRRFDMILAAAQMSADSAPGA